MYWALRFWDYRSAVERAGAAVLKESPDALIIVEILHLSSWLCSFQLRRHPLLGLEGHA